MAASYLGGPLAVRCVGARPDLVTSLVLTGFAPDPDRASFLAQMDGFRQLVAQSPDLSAEYDRLHGIRWQKTLTCFTDHVERRFEDTVLVRSSALVSLAVDVLIVNGDLKQKTVERRAAERQWEQRVTGRVVPGAGHLAGHDAPEVFNREVDRFWREGGNR